MGLQIPIAGPYALDRLSIPVVYSFDHPLHLYYIEPISHSSIGGHLTIYRGRSPNWLKDLVLWLMRRNQALKMTRTGVRV
jgi:hypothetical protein